MASSIPLQIAETIQTAHINRDPSSQHDINPSTAASRKEPVTLEEHPISDLHDEGIDEGDEDEDEIPYSVVRPKRRTSHLPPLPDLRFEQSYLHSISQASSWWRIAWITTRDQVMMPFAQGIIYNLGICGWQYWNRNARLSGNTVGAKVRRWWWGVNNWPISSGTSRAVRR
ncbi:hypothetical protein QBC33DRAFT_529129 [Phialemonium atrogriseum]|uniref:DUF1770 domain-containing protein n=1 Tax=Phialemonium atrogriseum TaxID=1093897 RepID=A0AAJ0C6V7_9PEZI|nr:uncharacterized protein QBC33DRAFT_529129 [Phialemonium atrogriseum]KAK1769792.1 hypothetical protein QBC33DRAFT_529129 [Phialemonium atrogriseum]